MGLMTERKYIRKDKMRGYLHAQEDDISSNRPVNNEQYIRGYLDALNLIKQYIEDRNDNGHTVTGAEAFAIDVNDYNFNPYANS